MRISTSAPHRWEATDRRGRTEYSGFLAWLFSVPSAASVSQSSTYLATSCDLTQYRTFDLTSNGDPCFRRKVSMCLIQLRTGHTVGTDTCGELAFAVVLLGLDSDDSTPDARF